MDNKLVNKLKKKYPKLVGKVAFECGDGWYTLLANLCSQLQFDTNHNNKYKLKYPQVTVTCIKEKFGTLRFYVDGATDEQYYAIHLAELMSANICEKCGKFDSSIEPEGRCWVYTRCKECKVKEIK